MTANDGDKAAAQRTRGLTVGDETRRSTRLAARPGESMTWGRTGYRQESTQDNTQDMTTRDKQKQE